MSTLCESVYMSALSFSLLSLQSCLCLPLCSLLTAGMEKYVKIGVGEENTKWTFCGDLKIFSLAGNAQSGRKHVM